ENVATVSRAPDHGERARVRRSPRIALADEEPAVDQERSGLVPSEAGAFAVGRIREDEVEPALLARETQCRTRGIAAHDLERGTQRSEVPLERPGVAVNDDCFLRAARDGLDRERPGSGVQLQHAR